MKLFFREKPKIEKSKTQDPLAFNGWRQCPKCQEMLHVQQLEKSFHCCPKCAYHYPLKIQERISLLSDSFEEMWGDLSPLDPLKFLDRESYPDRLQRATEESGRNEGVSVGRAVVEGRTFALGVLDFTFMAGSMGSVVGERLTRLIEWATTARVPLVIVSTSGGARMQESILSLMQMAKTSGALALLHDAGVPYISILAHPTLGGVTASFASLGDIILAEPDALIGFAGPRVVEQTIRQKLPPGAQKSEFLLEHGMIDAVIPRHELRQKLLFLFDFLVS